MLLAVRGSRDDFQVIRIVVKSVAISVVYQFIVSQWAPNLLLHDDSMLANVAAFDANE
jgi:hypothetical protein